MKKNLVIAFLVGVLTAQSARSLTGIMQMDVLIKEARAIAAKIEAKEATTAEQERLLVLLARFAFGAP